MTSVLLSKNFVHNEVEKKLYKEWLRKKLFKYDPESNKETFTIMMPPPNVTGNLHLGHALNMTLQDILARYWRLKDKDVLWQPGTDHAGIATQILVEKNLKKNNKLTKYDLGREAFLEEVWKWKEESGSQIIEQLKRIGASADWDRERFTLDEGLSKAVRKVFSDLFKEGLIYKDKRLVNWDVKLQTAISDLEVEQREVRGEFTFLNYPINNSEKFICVATTRPETMLGDVCVAVNPKDDRYKEFIGKEVFLPLVKKLIPIVADDYVDMEKGTGAVKITPAHDFNDYQLGLRHNLEVINILNDNGTLNKNVPKKYQNKDRLEVRKEVIEDMKELGLFVKSEITNHSVPYGDRSGTIIEPYLTNQWFVNVKSMAEKAIIAVKSGKTEFIPKSWEKVFYDWLENIEPWCISRQLWWGHQIPAWYGPDKKIFVAENQDNAQKQANIFYKKEVKLTQDEDVLDTWFSSAIWPMSTLGWPDKNIDLERYYPSSVLVTGFDIIFFWVARMMMQGLHFMKEVPFKKVYIHALVRDSNGQKMSKSKGNVIDPILLLDQYGADALRFTLTAMASQGRDIKLSEERVKGYRNFITKIWNASKYLNMNGCINKNINKHANIPLSISHPINYWILKNLEASISDISKSIEKFKFNEAANVIYLFIWSTYCDWYLEFTKVLLNEGNEKKTIEETKLVSNYVFLRILHAAHPVIPFITDELHITFNDKEKFILEEKWPKVNLEVNQSLNINDIHWLKSIISNIRSVRSSLNIPPKTILNMTIINLKVINSKRLLFYKEFFSKLAKVNIINNQNVTEDGQAKFILDGETYLIEIKGIIDIKAEKNRINIEILKINKEINRLDGKLNNENFLSRAPKKIVDEENKKRELYKDNKIKMLKALEIIDYE